MKDRCGNCVYWAGDDKSRRGGCHMANAATGINYKCSNYIRIGSEDDIWRESDDVLTSGGCDMG